MATLEIHEAGQRVRRVRIGRSHPVMFGTNPLCEVPLNDPSLRAFHGRIRWSKTKFKAEAVAEVPYIEVNGTRVKSKSLRQGDEVRVGHTRIFLLSIEDDGPEHGEKTVIQEPPLAKDYAGLPLAAPEPDYARMEMAAPSLEIPDPEETVELTVTRAARQPDAPLPRSSWRDRSRSAAPQTVFDDMEDLERDDEPGSVATAVESSQPRDPLSWPKRLLGLIRGTDRPPDDERVFSSPVVIGLALTFIVLVGLSFGLYRVIVLNEARQRFAAATESYDKGDFRAAIKGYDAYLQAEPDGKRAGKAQVYRALSRVRQHTSATSGSWTNAFKEAEAMLGEVADVAEYRDVSVDLATEVRGIAEGMLDRARDLADPAWLTQANRAIAFHARVAGSAADSLLARSKVPDKLAQAEAAIRKTADLKAAVAAIEAAIKANRPADAYHARSAIIRRYPDLGADKNLAARLGKINDLVRAAVRFDPSGRPGLTDPWSEPLGPPTSLVNRLDPAKPAERTGPVAFALADGWAWGFDASTGAPLWQYPVGQAAPFAPVRVEGGTTALVLMVDARTNELVCREARSGRFVWRQTLEGRATDPPLVLGARVLQPVVDGRVLELDLKSGDLRGTLQLGRPITRALVVNESAEQAFLLGAEDCLFTLSLDPLASVAVEFLGHDAGTIACSPTRAGRLFVLPENHDFNAGRWRIFLMNATGAGFRQVQEIPIAGWTWGSPVASGPVIWSASDRGEVAAFAIGRLDSKTPLAPIAQLAAGTKLQGPAWPIARSDREFTVASGLSGRYDLDIDQGKLTPVWTLGTSGRALAPAQTLGKLTVLTQQPDRGQGAALWGVDSASGAVRWRTIVGAAWPARWIEAASGDAITTLLTDGRDLTLTRDQLRAGGFVEQALPPPGTADLVTPDSLRLEVDGATVLVPTPDADQVLVRDSASGYRPVPLPAHLAALPLPIGKNILVPGMAGRVYLVDAHSGLSVADPFVPPFDRSKPTRWRTPVALDGEASLVSNSDGVLRRLVVETNPRPRLVVANERKLDSPLLGNPASTGAAVLVVTADRKIRSFSARDLAPIGSWPITTAPAFDPVVVAGFAFVVDATGQVFAFDADGRRLWTATLREPTVVGTPVLRGNAVWFATRGQSGVEALSTVDGTSLGATRLDAEIAAGLLISDTDLVIPTGSSTWQTFLPPQQAGGSPR